MVGNIVVIVEAFVAVIMGVGGNEHADSVELADSKVIKLIKLY